MTLPAKKISDSKVTLSVGMGPQETNSLGNVHGGVIMKLVDEAAGFAALRHSRRPCVTVAVDSMTFMHPIHVGMLVTFNAELSYVGRTSMEVFVEVITENALEGTSRLSNTAYLVFVALGDDGRPVEVPPLVYETDTQRKRADAAIERQAYRKRQRAQEAE
jgi:uncharacterized protein (TIGR00369 family)